MTRTFGWVLAVIFMVGVVSAGSGEALALKNQKRYSIDTVQQALRVVDELPTNAQKLTAEALQLALNIEPEQSYAKFKRSRDRFESVLATLYRGDESLALPVPTDPKLAKPLQKLQTVWDQINVPVQRVLETGNVSRDDLRLLAELDSKLVEASNETERAYQKMLLAQVPHSIALNTMVKAEQLSFLVEQMTTEFLLIAYDHEAARHRHNLSRSAAEFELILNGLIHGDPNLQLVAAHDPNIAMQLMKVEMIWLEVAETFRRTADRGETADPETLYRITERMEPLFLEMEKSVDLLEQL